MQQLVTITSQGQITIPSSMRRLLGLDEFKKALIQTKKNKIIVEPVPNILSLGGILQKKAIKNKDIKKIIELEEKAIATTISKKYSS